MSAAGDLAARGVAHLPGLLARETAAALAAEADRFATTSLTPGPYGAICHNLWRKVDAFAAAAETHRLGELAAELLGGEALLFQDHLVSKPAGTRAEIAWHQDYSYWPLDRPHGLTLWIALDEVTAGPGGNGCLRYAPGTHLLGERQAADFIRGAHREKRADLLPLEPQTRQTLDLPVAAGDALVHHPLVWHMSPPNPSPRPRRAWSLTIVSPEVRWAPAHAPHPFNHQLSLSPGDSLDGPLFPRATARQSSA